MRSLRATMVTCCLTAALPVQAQEGVVPEAVPVPQPAPAAAAPDAPIDTAPPSPPEAAGGHDRGAASPSHAGPAVTGGPTTAEEDVWRFTYSGYFRAPMRVGSGKREHPAGGQSATTLHVPVIPDDQYLSWQQTRHNQKDWAELFFTVGNSWASGTVALQGFQFTDAAWTDPQTQFGISQAYVTLTPQLPWDGIRLVARAGSFWSRYGAAGRYDAGEYDTFLFGRTHVMGELLRLEADVGDQTVYVEHGLGTKRPNPSVFNRTRFTLLNHVHAGVNWNHIFDLGLHYLHSWTQEEERHFGPFDPPTGAVWFGENTPDPIPDGSLTVFGADARADLGELGYFYLGVSRIQAEHAFTVAPAIEVLHSNGGGEYSIGVVDNYFEPPTGQDLSVDPDVNPYNCRNAEVWLGEACSKGNGSVDTLLAQYEVNVTGLIAGLTNSEPILGAGRDLSLKLYGMLNQVQSDNRVLYRDKAVWSDHRKLKYGADASLQLFPGLALGARFDRLQPNSEIPAQSFGVFSPRVVFKTQLVTRESIELQYSRYSYEQRVCPPDDPLACVQPVPAGSAPEGYGTAPALNQDSNIRGASTTRPDVNVIKLQASMWW